MKVTALNLNLTEEYLRDRQKVEEEILSKYTCVILTECEWHLGVEINEYCRSKGISFLMSDVKGLFGYSFTDFGSQFQVVDTNGEDCREQFLSSIKKSEEEKTDESEIFTLECVDSRFHNLEAGDHVRLSEIEGLVELNDKIFQVTSVVSPSKFQISHKITDKTAPIKSIYTGGGLFKQVKVPVTLNFKSLREQIETPDLTLINFAKPDQPILIHNAFRALHSSTSSSFDEIFFHHLQK